MVMCSGVFGGVLAGGDEVGSQGDLIVNMVLGGIYLDWRLANVSTLASCFNMAECDWFRKGGGDRPAKLNCDVRRELSLISKDALGCSFGILTHFDGL